MTVVEVIKQLYKERKKDFIKSDLYKELLNKYNYQKVKNYCPLDQVILNNLLTTDGSKDTLDVSFNTDNYANDTTWQIGVCSALDIFNEQIPVYWLEKSWLKMMLDTDLPKVIDEINIPFESALLLLPQNLIISPDNLPLDWVYFKYIKKGKYWRDIIIEGDRFTPTRSIQYLPTEVDKITWVTSIQGIIYQSTIEVSQGEIKRGDFNLFNYPEGFYPEANEALKEKIFTESVGDLIIKMLLFLQIHPEVLETLIGQDSSLSHRPRTKKNTKLSPRWIKNPSETTTINKRVPTGSHASPKTHFRRGHLRRVAVGKGRSDRKWVWIKPTIVNEK